MDTDGSCTLPAPYRQGRRLEQEALEERRVLHRLRQDPRVMGAQCNSCALPAPNRQGRCLERKALERGQAVHPLHQGPGAMGTECTTDAADSLRSGHCPESC
jgi:hypothetical protein